jgi:hypothetical protein
MKGRPAGQHLVEHRAEREDVAALVRLAAFQLLRRHVLEGAENRALLRQRLGHGQERRPGDGRFGGELRQAEVEQFGGRRTRQPGAADEHHVTRLEIPMHDATAVRGLERAGDVDRDRDRVVEWQRAALEAGGERLPLEELHDQEVGAVLAAEIEQGADVGM